MMPEVPQPHRARGFTLLEMLVAIGIFAIVSAMAYGSLSQVLRGRDRVTAERKFWTGLALTFERLQDDLSEARPRTGRDIDGRTLPAFIVQPTDTRALAAPSLEFTRGGGLVMDNAVRSDLERVAYQLRDGVLWRLSWPVLDRAPDTKPVEAPVLRQVTDFRVRAFTPDGQWVDFWPTPSLMSLTQNVNVPQNLSATQNPLPRGIEIKLTIEHRGSFTRLFLIHE